MRLYRRLYAWMMSWGDSPFGGVVLFLVALIEAAFFPLPPEVLLVTLVLGRPVLAWRFAALGTAGAAGGSAVGYAIGWGLWGLADGLFYRIPGVSPADFAAMAQGYEQYGALIVLLSAMSPVPYTLVTVSAGVFGMNFGYFMLASAVGRGAKFFLVAALLWRFGPSIRPHLDKYPERVGMLLLVVLVGLGIYALV